MDYNATTPLEAEVVQTVSEALQEAWGNPSSSYPAGKKSSDQSTDLSHTTMLIFPCSVCRCQSESHDTAVQRELGQAGRGPSPGYHLHVWWNRGVRS